MARPAGIEPATAGLEGRCSIRLSYGRLKKQKLRAPNVFPRPMLGSPANRIGSARGLYRTFPAFEAQSLFGRPSGRWRLFRSQVRPEWQYRCRIATEQFFEIGRGNRITRRCAPRPPGRRLKAAGAQRVRTAALVLGAARLALRVAGSKPPALNLAFGQVVEPDLFYVAGSTRMAISMPNRHGTIF